MKQSSKKVWKPVLKITTLFIIFSLVLSMFNIMPSQNVSAASSYLLSKDRPAFASSIEGNSFTADKAFDGDTSSRWASAWGSDPQWIYVDLGAVAVIDRVVITWQSAYSKSYKIQVSNNEINWTDIHSTTLGSGGVEDITLSGTGRYVRMLSTQRFKPQYGVSLFEFEVYGTGGVNLPSPSYGTNVALNKPTYVSSAAQPASQAVDGNDSTRWVSNASDDQWIYVDLGSVRTLGRVIINWDNAGRTYDLQVSNDATNWTTVFREMNGDGEPINLPIYASSRYLRMKGIIAVSSSGYSISEFKVYDYITGDPKPTYTITPIPVLSTVAVGQGSYALNDLTIRQPKAATYKSANVTSPLPSNDWWQSMLIDKLGGGIITLPLKAKYTKQGLGLLTPGAGYVKTSGNGITADGPPDLYVTANNISPATILNRITGYSDWSVDVVLSDNNVDKMKTTFVKGSPYLYSLFNDATTPEIYLPATTRFFDDNNNTILTTDGATFTGDHIGIEIINSDGAPTPSMVTRSYGVFAPPGTVFTRAGVKLKLSLGGGQNYLSLATLPVQSQLNYFYQHAYAFVTSTNVSYSYNETTSDVTTNFNVATSLKRTGFANTTLMTQFPHQWKITTTPLTALTYLSIRGLLKVVEGNSFTTVDKFYGIVPQFTEPGDSTYSRQTLLQYLAVLDTEMSKNLMQKDAYWQGKKLQPLAMGVLMADQIGDENYKNIFLGRIKTILVDWYTYTSGEPNYYFAYNPEWGTMYYKHSDYSSNSANLTDHHFTNGYFVFASAVLATYDQDFKDKYSGMVEHLIRDYANPSKSDTLYPFFRNFDPYDGHSWAGGYGDNANGNNQEAAGEALFSWVGQYMWGIATGNTTYRDAGIYGFTTELKAIEQYWFNYDNDNWLPGYNHKTVGQVYGSAINFGTFFSGNPYHVYGIHWLPTAEYLTSYAFDPAKAGAMYSGMVADNSGPETGWYHTIWPIQSLSDPQAVLNKWDVTNMQKDAEANTYWFVHNMATLGQRTKDIWASGGTSATVYKKGSTYSALVWNPSSSSITVTFRNAGGVTGTATVPAKSLIKVNPMQSGSPGGGSTINLALNKTVTSSANPKKPASNAVDGDSNTRWESEQSDPQWIQVDLGSTSTIDRVVLDWQNSYGKSYRIETSTNGTSWTEVYFTTSGSKGINDISFPAVSARYVKLTGIQRGSQYGYSLWEFEVYGSGGTTTLSPPTLTADTTQNNVGQPMEITFTDNSSWRNAISSVKVDGTIVNSSQYTLTAGKLTLNTSLFPTARTYEVTITATGYMVASVQQSVVTPGTALNLALNKSVTSSANAKKVASNAVDGDTSTRWESDHSDPQWIAIDLGATYAISHVILDWQSAYGKSYVIEISLNGSSWTTVYSTTSGKGGIEDITFTSSQARYVRMTGTERGTRYGYSLLEFEVYS
ncbi:MAG: discoidin domain-containing protein [Candidatus Cohnella colombiensis]|uniref:glucan endo-1,3-beta-D-glucosidase n=1 Tax=Candidatus Cohnella colombiensis TaxID=3121368 RepID=A0AA95EZR9_9BACL|nr:MAG: discoidin domain-containing protein [Cohnella sp.]